MAVSLTHAKVSTTPDDAAAIAQGDVLPSDWDAQHVLTLATGKLLGRSTAGTGAAEEITPSSPLVLSAGALSVTGANLTASNDTNVTLTIGGNLTGQLVQSSSITAGWTGTLAAARLNGNVVQGVTNDTNVTGSIATQNLTLGWTGTLAAGRLNANVVQSVVNDTNVTGSISAQALTLGWTSTLAVSRGGTGAGTFTAHGILLGEGTGAIVPTAAMTDGQLLVGQSGADPLPKTIGTDATISAAGALTIANSAVTNAKMANMAAYTIKMNNSGSSAAPGDVTIDGLTAKATPVGADELMIWDVAGSAMKKATITNVVGASGVSTFNGRSGAVSPATGDYDVTNIYNEMWFGGRLTLTTATPVLSANTTAKGTVYYTPYLNNLISIYDGTRFVTFTFSELSVVLDATNVLSGKNYDFFVFLNSGSPALGYAAAWTNSTTRSVAIAKVNGVNTNSGTTTMRLSSSTTASISANQATYVGTIHATANAQTGMNFTPSAAAGGSANILGVYNAFNKVPVIAICRDSTASWTYGTATWRAADNNSNNSISFMDGQGDVSTFATYDQTLGSLGTSSTTGPAIGINLNSTSATPPIQALVSKGSGATVNTQCNTSVSGAFLPALGYNAINAVEFAGDANSYSFYGSGFGASFGQSQGLTAWLWM